MLKFCTFLPVISKTINFASNQCTINYLLFINFNNFWNYKSDLLILNRADFCVKTIAKSLLFVWGQLVEKEDEKQSVQSFPSSLSQICLSLRGQLLVRSSGLRSFFAPQYSFMGVTKADFWPSLQFLKRDTSSSDLADLWQRKYCWNRKMESKQMD